MIDVRSRAAEVYGRVLDAYERCLYCSFHTTAGYLRQGVAARLRSHGVSPYVEFFRSLFPEGAGYRHDQLDARTELSDEQRDVEPPNADSHLAFMAGGLDTCVSYRMHRPGPVCLIDLDGVYKGQPRRRQTLLVGYNHERVVARTKLEVPVSAHPIDAINLKEPRLGLYGQLADFLAAHEVPHGRVRLDLAPGEQHSSLTINEYETLLMRHDLVEVLRDPLRFALQTARHAVTDPAAVPFRAIEYAKYDFPQTLNRLVDALGLGQSRVERLLARALALPAERFLRMRRSVSLPVSNASASACGHLVEGTYQSPILVQWRSAPRGARTVNVTLTRFD
ncbi:MAG: hypothetical protein KJ066_05950 [Acidobacteria bacterium]|nr:hypothetical protein [Acidobacteriota bacterium]